MIRITGIRVDITNKEELISILAKKLRVKQSDIKNFKIHKKSIDARSKMYFSYVYDFDFSLDFEDTFLKNTKLKNVSKIGEEKYIIPIMGAEKLSYRPVIVGSGPAGLFAGFMLALEGYKPIIIERGEKIEDRVKTVDLFWDKGILNNNSNVQFGEGGAGTFSDGKLNTLVKDKNYRMKLVFETFVECGAKEEILYDSKPHIGTDVLRKVIINLRKKIISLGGEFRYNSLMEDILIENGEVKGIVVNNEVISTNVLVLAIGHSARETYKMLHEKGIILDSKPFAIGIRIMHDQNLINENQYPINYPFLPPANYKLTYKAKNNRGVYSFCMCPGGYVVNASSKNNHLVINGMSNHNRDSGVANSAIIVTINKDDFGNNPLDGMHFLEKIEERAYKVGNGKLLLENFKDYEKHIKSKGVLDKKISLKGDYILEDLNSVFPDYINESLKEGINYFDSKIHGFSEGVIVAPETRTSSPVKILRNESLESNIKGIYPCGEGSGYAGGITTSAIDGIKVFESIMSKYHNFTNKNSQNV